MVKKDKRVSEHCVRLSSNRVGHLENVEAAHLDMCHTIALELEKRGIAHKPGEKLSDCIVRALEMVERDRDKLDNELDEVAAAVERLQNVDVDAYISLLRRFVAGQIPIETVLLPYKCRIAEAKYNEDGWNRRDERIEWLEKNLDSCLTQLRKTRAELVQERNRHRNVRFVFPHILQPVDGVVV